MDMLLLMRSFLFLFFNCLMTRYDDICILIIGNSNFKCHCLQNNSNTTHKKEHCLASQLTVEMCTLTVGGGVREINTAITIHYTVQ